jgi:DNA-binding NarL/FixJ family response regulator
LTFDYSAPFVNAIWKSGALGFVMKSDVDRDLIAAGSAVRRGERSIAPQAEISVAPASSGNASVSERLGTPNVEVRAQVRQLAERMKRML